jgi:hypothetical protein
MKLRWSHVALGLGSLLMSGCTALKEIPRSQYAALPQRKHVRVMTSDNLVYEFDYIQIQADTLAGFRRRDVETRFDEFATVRVPLTDVTHLAARGVDWYKTGLIGSGMIAAVVAAGMSTRADQPPGGGGGGGKGGGVD